MDDHNTEKPDAVMDTASVPDAIAWQADHAQKAGAPNTARVIRALLALEDCEAATARRIFGWQGLCLADAMPLRINGGLHRLALTGEAPRLADAYSGLVSDQTAVDGIVREAVETFDTMLLPWLDGPPQTNEAGRSASIMAGLMWLASRTTGRFELLEIGASAGINTMMDRYGYDLGGVLAGPQHGPMQIAPEWRGNPPPEAAPEIVSARGCDLAPLDLTDPDAVLRLKSFVWPEATQRMARIDAAAALAVEAAPEVARQDAAIFVADALSRPQSEGITRVLFHTIVWQYLPEDQQAEIEEAMVEAGAKADADRPLAWLALETNRETFRHELHARFWPEGEDPVLLAEAHPHGAWIEWKGAP